MLDEKARFGRRYAPGRIRGTEPCRLRLEPVEQSHQSPLLCVTRDDEARQHGDAETGQSSLPDHRGGVAGKPYLDRNWFGRSAQTPSLGTLAKGQTHMLEEIAGRLRPAARGQIVG